MDSFGRRKWWGRRWRMRRKGRRQLKSTLSTGRSSIFGMTLPVLLSNSGWLTTALSMSQKIASKSCVILGITYHSKHYQSINIAHLLVTGLLMTLQPSTPFTRERLGWVSMRHNDERRCMERTSLTLLCFPSGNSLFNRSISCGCTVTNNYSSVHCHQNTF